MQGDFSQRGRISHHMCVCPWDREIESTMFCSLAPLLCAKSQANGLTVCRITKSVLPLPGRGGEWWMEIGSSATHIQEAPLAPTTPRMNRWDEARITPLVRVAFPPPRTLQPLFGTVSAPPTAAQISIGATFRSQWQAVSWFYRWHTSDRQTDTCTNK